MVRPTPPKKIIIALMCILALLGMLYVRTWFLPGSGLIVDFLDIGQGDASLIRTPAGKKILVDCGPDNAVLQELGAVLPFYDRVIDLMVVTHPHADHLAGCFEVMRRYEVRQIMWNGETHGSATFRAWLALARTFPMHTVITTEEIALEPEISISVLWPDSTKELASAESAEKDGVNNSSIVFILSHGINDFLFTGDAEEPVERALVAVGRIPDIEVLKVGHHGSAYGTGEVLLGAARPEIAVMMVGARNSYGHPSRRVLRRLEAAGVREVYRTDQDGRVEVVSDGKGLSVHRYGRKDAH